MALMEWKNVISMKVLKTLSRLWILILFFSAIQAQHFELSQPQQPPRPPQPHVFPHAPPLPPQPPQSPNNPFGSNIPLQQPQLSCLGSCVNEEKIKCTKEAQPICNQKCTSLKLVWGNLQKATYLNWISLVEKLNILEPAEIMRLSKMEDSSPKQIFLLLRKLKQRSLLTNQLRVTIETIFSQLDKCCKPKNGWLDEKGTDYESLLSLDNIKCHVSHANEPVVPTIVYSQWISHLRKLGLLSNKEICDGEDYARTKPNKLVEMLSLIKSQRSEQLSALAKDHLERIITDVGRYIALGNPKLLPTNYFINVPLRIAKWRQKLDQISQIETVEKSLLDNLRTIMTTAKTASDSMMMMSEIRALLTRLGPKAKDHLGQLLIDMKRTVLKQKLAHLLTNHDENIDVGTKQKLAMIITLEDKVGGQEVMMEQLQQIITLVQNLMRNRQLPMQMSSDLLMWMTKLGIEVDQQTSASTFEFYGGIQRFVKMSIFLAQLSATSKATFSVPTQADCDLDKLCQQRMIESVCTYGYSGCMVRWKNVNGAINCTLEVMDCQKQSNIPQLNDEQTGKMLKTQKFAATIAFSQEACSDLAKQFRLSGFGGTSITDTFDMKTKTCTLKVTGELADEKWLNKQCGCQFNKLKFLDIHEVSRKAAFGVKFKTHDQATCKDFCSMGGDIPTSCTKAFDCRVEAKCWPSGICICTVRHICKDDLLLTGNRKKLAKANAQMTGNMTFSETVKQPLQEPTITTCSVMLERKEKTAVKKSMPGSASKKHFADSNELLG